MASRYFLHSFEIRVVMLLVWEPPHVWEDSTGAGGMELFIEEPNSNPRWVRYVHLC